jgi:Zinc carboxypeptidase
MIKTFRSDASQKRPVGVPYFELSTLYAALFLAIALVCQAHAQDLTPKPKTPYSALGAPSNPKIPQRWNRYHDYAEGTELLKKLAEQFPKLCQLQSAGKSFGGREMWVLTVADPAGKTPPDVRPAFWIDGGIHANEIQSVEAVLYTAWFLAESHAENELVQRLLQERTFYLMPMMSPDSRDAHFYQPNSVHTPRTGLRPRDDDMDGLVDEDGPDDMDGDGHISFMRVRDPNGNFKTHPDFPQLIVLKKPEEKGEFTYLGMEGFDNDGDGLVHEDGDGFYDPNRDWGWDWQPNYIERGGYRYPFSILENRMVADFVAARPQIAAAQSYHNAGGMILRGPGTLEGHYEPEDIAIYDRLGKMGEKILPGYRYLHSAKGLYEIHGDEIDWLHQMRGAFGITNELFSPFNYFRTGGHAEYFGSDELQRTFNKYLLLEEGIIGWKEVAHPQYGKVEIGGLKKNWIRQPPSFLLEEELHRNMCFTFYCADEMPLVRVQAVEMKPLAGELRQITAIIENQKFAPTHSVHDVKTKITPPDLVTLAGDGKIIAGLISDDQFFDEAKEQKRRPQSLELPTLAGNKVLYVRWLVQGPGPWTVEVKSVKGGRDSKQVE